MAASTIVDSLHSEIEDLLAFLDKSNEISLRNTVDGNFRKALLLAAASNYEKRLTDAVVNFVQEVTSRDHVVSWLVQNRVVARHYHTWFDWNQANANHFFGMFGQSFRRHVQSVIREDDGLSLSVRAFLEIGRDRNRMVHDDFGSFSLEKTSGEIYETYQIGSRFVEWVPQVLREYCLVRATQRQGASEAAAGREGSGR